MSSLISWSDYCSAFGLASNDDSKAIVEAAIPGVSDQVQTYLDRTFCVANNGVEWIQPLNPGMSEYFPQGKPIIEVQQALFLGGAINVVSTISCWVNVSLTGLTIATAGNAVTPIAWVDEPDIDDVAEALSQIPGVTASVVAGVDPELPSDTLYPTTIAIAANVPGVLLGGTTPASVTVRDGNRIVVNQFLQGFPISPVWNTDPSLLVQPTLQALFIRTRWGYEEFLPPGLVRTVCEWVRDAAAIAAGNQSTGFAGEVISKYSYTLEKGVSLADLTTKYASRVQSFKSVIFG